MRRSGCTGWRRPADRDVQGRVSRRVTPSAARRETRRRRRAARPGAAGGRQRVGGRTPMITCPTQEMSRHGCRPGRRRATGNAARRREQSRRVRAVSGWWKTSTSPRITVDVDRPQRRCDPPGTAAARAGRPRVPASPVQQHAQAAMAVGVGHPAEDAALGLDHGQPDALELGEVRGDAVRQHDASRSRGRWPRARWCARTPRA